MEWVFEPTLQLVVRMAEAAAAAVEARFVGGVVRSAMENCLPGIDGGGSGVLSGPVVEIRGHMRRKQGRTEAELVDEVDEVDGEMGRLWVVVSKTRARL